MPNLVVIVTKGTLPEADLAELDSRVRGLLKGYKILNPVVEHIRDQMQLAANAVVKAKKIEPIIVSVDSARAAFASATGLDVPEKVALLGADNLNMDWIVPAYSSVGLQSAQNRRFRIMFDLGGKDEVVSGQDIRTNAIRQQVSYAIGDVISQFMKERYGLTHNIDYVLTGGVNREDREIYRDKAMMDKGINDTREARAASALGTAAKPS